MTISEEKKCVTIFVISDSAGETASKLAAASMAQYPTVDFTLIRRTFVKDEDKLVQALSGIIGRKGLVGGSSRPV